MIHCSTLLLAINTDIAWILTNKPHIIDNIHDGDKNVKTDNHFVICVNTTYNSQFIWRLHIFCSNCNIFSFGTSRGAGGGGGSGGVRRRTVLQKTGLAGDSEYQCGPVCNNVCALMWYQYVQLRIKINFNIRYSYPSTDWPTFFLPGLAPN